MSKKAIVATTVSVGIVALMMLAAWLVAQAVSNTEFAATACSRQDQEAYIALRDTVADNDEYVSGLGDVADRIKENNNYTDEPSCAFVVFKYEIATEDTDGAQEVLDAVKASARRDSTYIADTSLIRQMEAELAFPSQIDNRILSTTGGG